MSDSFALGRSLDSAPTDGSAVRSADERKAQLLGFLQKSHLLETSQVSMGGYMAMLSVKAALHGKQGHKEYNQQSKPLCRGNLCTVLT